MEIKTKITGTLIRMGCGNCKEGEMQATGEKLGIPPRYAHRCSNKDCRNETAYGVYYPYIEDNENVVYKIKKI